ncbi:SDR family NAD(P)-dependent oxidoreductase [Embleya sp. NPDC050154]|uniref:SDR family NAD(P)-dependent oxidoreductase n=1 Tax=unclassified Embleya TaxID=2699296 RepID=UPI00379224D6
MNVRPRDRVAMVVASSAGVGLAAAKGLAVRGAHVSLCDLDPRRLARAHVEVNALGPGDVLSMPVDPYDPCAVAEWVRRTADNFGGLDIVVTNSGPITPGPVDGFRLADYRAAIDANLLPHVSATLAALPIVKRGGWGRLLLIAPAKARRPHGREGLSGMARMGLIGYLRGLVDTLDGTGVTANVLVPGAGPGAGPRLWGDPGAGAEIARVADRIRGEGTREGAEFGALAAYLASERAEPVTGLVFDTHGGDVGAMAACRG